MNPNEPGQTGHYLIMLSPAQFAAARRALKAEGIDLTPLHYAELGHRSETICTIGAAAGIVRDALDEQGLTLRDDLTWEQLRRIAEHCANRPGWTSNYEADADEFLVKFPEFVQSVNPQ